MENPVLVLRTGEGKRTWYGYTVEYGSWSSDLQFIDKIHYDYLKSLQAKGNDSLKEDEE